MQIKTLVSERYMCSLKSHGCVHIQLQKDGSRQSKQNSSLGLRSTHSSGPPSHSLHSSGSRSKEIVITDPYLDALTKETKARTRNRKDNAEVYVV